MLVSFLFLPFLGHGGQRFGNSGLSQKRFLIYFLPFKRRQNKIESHCAEDSAMDLPTVTRPNSGASRGQRRPLIPDKVEGGKRAGSCLCWCPERGRSCSSLRVRLLGSSHKSVRMYLECTLPFLCLGFSFSTLGMLLLAQPT